MQNNQPKASRRGFFVSASVAGAALTSVGWLKTSAPTAAVTLPKPAPVGGGGYALSDHVKQYYKTARV